jgi:hypothetical protein
VAEPDAGALLAALTDALVLDVELAADPQPAIRQHSPAAAVTRHPALATGTSMERDDPTPQTEV